MRPILILTGVETEARALARGLGLPRLELPFPAFGDERARVAPVGPGAGRLEERLPALASGLESPLLVSAGLCGALAPSLSRRDLVVPEAVLDEAGGRHAVGAALPGREARGDLLAVSAIVSTPGAKSRLYVETGALAVDMESGPILAAAGRRGWPTLVVRAVSDHAQEALPAALLDAVDAGGRVRVARALAILFRGDLTWRALALRRDAQAGLAAVAALIRPLLS